jgi:hypothetical protein
MCLGNPLEVTVVELGITLITTLQEAFKAAMTSPIERKLPTFYRQDIMFIEITIVLVLYFKIECTKQ